LIISLLGFNRPGLQVEIDHFLKASSLDKDQIVTYTKAAFSQARQKIKSEAFITIKDKQLAYFNQYAPLKSTWMGYRVVAIDGSSLILPKKQNLVKHFGTFKNSGKVENPGARISAAYDICNQLILDAQIGKMEVGEQSMARKHLKSLNPNNDLLLFDRGYPSIGFALELDSEGFRFCFRLSTAWKEAHDLLQITEDVDWVLKKGKRYKVGKDEKGKNIENYLSQDFKGFRLVKIILESGETEVLLTNLADRNLFSLNTLKDLYHMRWSIEECYKRIKQVSQIEFFSGYSVKAVEQDFHARIVLLNLAAMIETQHLQLRLDERKCKHKLQVNRTQVNAKLKDFLYDILYRPELGKSINKMLQLLVNAYDIVRGNRRFKRNMTYRYKRKPLNYKAF